MRDLELSSDGSRIDFGNLVIFEIEVIYNSETEYKIVKHFSNLIIFTWECRSTGASWQVESVLPSRTTEVKEGVGRR